MKGSFFVCKKFPNFLIRGKIKLANLPHDGFIFKNLDY